jgi:hypothetical protein
MGRLGPGRGGARQGHITHLSLPVGRSARATSVSRDAETATVFHPVVFSPSSAYTRLTSQYRPPVASGVAVLFHQHAHRRQGGGETLQDQPRGDRVAGPVPTVRHVRAAGQPVQLLQQFRGGSSPGGASFSTNPGCRGRSGAGPGRAWYPCRCCRSRPPAFMEYSDKPSRKRGEYWRHGNYGGPIPWSGPPAPPRHISPGTQAFAAALDTTITHTPTT